MRGRVGGAVALFAWLDSLLPTQDSSGSSLPVALINMVVGVLLVVLALREWHGRPAHRLARYEDEQRMVFGRNTYQTFAQILGSDADEAGYDRARLIQADYLDNKSAADLAASLVDALDQLQRLQRSLDRRSRRDELGSEKPH